MSVLSGGTYFLFWQIFFQTPSSFRELLFLSTSSRDDQLGATGLVLSGKLPTATPLHAQVRAGDPDPELQLISLAGDDGDLPYLPDFPPD